MAFAQVSDIEARWRNLTDEEAKIATTLLEDASVALSAEMKRYGVEIDGTDEQATALCAVVCNMVKRALAAANDADLSSLTQTVGSFSETMAFSNPDGSLYLRESDRRMLGLYRKQVIRPVKCY